MPIQYQFDCLQAARWAGAAFGAKGYADNVKLVDYLSKRAEVVRDIDRIQFFVKDKDYIFDTEKNYFDPWFLDKPGYYAQDDLAGGGSAQ